MARLPLARQSSGSTVQSRTAEALTLAARLPRLALEARRIAMTVAAGLHGRRQAGPGENFWQYRAFSNGEAASRIDWRRSARHSGAYFVREREWEAAHTVHLWIDQSPSMAYRSPLAPVSKSDRAVVLGLALADLLVRGGERIALMGLTHPLATRRVIDQFCEALAHPAEALAHTPPLLPLPSLSEAVLVSDVLKPLPECEAMIATLAGAGARGHLLRLVDPVEEDFPFEGEAELMDLESAEMMAIGDAGAFRARYRAAMAAHDAGLRAICTRRGWSYLVHHTDQPATSALMALTGRLAAHHAVNAPGAVSFR